MYCTDCGGKIDVNGIEVEDISDKEIGVYIECSFCGKDYVITIAQEDLIQARP